jgi:hypothetical protein
MIDLSPSRDPADLIDAIFAVRRQDRRDLQTQIERLLDHAEPIVREEALALLLTRWKTRSLRPTARRLLLKDRDAGVRARAALGLASISTPDTRREDAQLLAEVFDELGVPPQLRCACVEALALMAGRPRLVELDDASRSDVEGLLREILAVDQ